MTNLLLHAATTALLFLVLWKATGDLWPSALVAAVFAVHPLRVEPVAWIAERKGLLAGLFWMLTLAVYVRYARRPFSLAAYMSMTALFALGLMSKPVLVTLPFVMLLLDYWPLGRMNATKPRSSIAPSPARSSIAPFSPLHLPLRRRARSPIAALWRLIAEKLPLLAMSAAVCLAALCPRQGRRLARRAAHVHALANALVSYLVYAEKLFWPADLAVLYPYAGDGPRPATVVVACLVLGAVSVAAVVYRRKLPYLFVGWFWYLGTLVPMIGLAQVGTFARADRYTYVTQIGLYLAAAWGVWRLVAWRPRCRFPCGVAATLVVACLMSCAWRQTSYWRDSETLWTRAIECTSSNAVAHNNLGNLLGHRSQDEAAIAHFRAAIAIYADYAEAHYNLGQEMAKQGRLDAAADCYRTALTIDPDYAEAHNNLGVILAGQGATMRRSTAIVGRWQSRPTTRRPTIISAARWPGAANSMRPSSAIVRRSDFPKGKTRPPRFAGCRLRRAGPISRGGRDRPSGPGRGLRRRQYGVGRGDSHPAQVLRSRLSVSGTIASRCRVLNAHPGASGGRAAQAIHQVLDVDALTETWLGGLAVGDGAEIGQAGDVAFDPAGGRLGRGKPRRRRAIAPAGVDPVPAPQAAPRLVGRRRVVPPEIVRLHTVELDAPRDP